MEWSSNTCGTVLCSASRLREWYTVGYLTINLDLLGVLAQWMDREPTGTMRTLSAYGLCAPEVILEMPKSLAAWSVDHSASSLANFVLNADIWAPYCLLAVLVQRAVKRCATKRTIWLRWWELLAKGCHINHWLYSTLVHKLYIWQVLLSKDIISTFIIEILKIYHTLTPIVLLHFPSLCLFRRYNPCNSAKHTCKTGCDLELILSETLQLRMN
jgi:hypothetical protein